MSGKGLERGDVTPQYLTTKEQGMKKILTAADIQEHVGDLQNVEMAPAWTLLQNTAESCVDGRESKGAISTPGGNAGEFGLFVSAVEQVIGQQLPVDKIAAFFREYVTKFGKFYMHTDEHALQHVEDQLRNNSAFAGKDIAVLVKSCPTELRQALLEALTNPDNMGCGHLKLSIKHAGAYGTRPEIVQTMTSEFYTQLWSGNQDMELRILPGDHEEGAVVNVLVEGDIEESTQIPTIAPMANGTSFFAYHPQVIEYVRRTTAQLVADESMINGLDSTMVDQLVETMTTLGNQQLGETVGALAKGLPIFNLSFNADKSFNVAEAGQVPA